MRQITVKSTVKMEDNMFQFKRILELVVFTWLFVWFVYKLIARKPLMPLSSVKPSFRDWYEPRLKVVDTILKLIVGPVIAICAWTYVLPFTLDIPDMITGNYQYVEGTVLSKQYDSRYANRLIKVEDEDTGETVTISCDYNKANKGDYIKIKYLKHTKEGVVVEHKKK